MTPLYPLMLESNSNAPRMVVSEAKDMPKVAALLAAKTETFSIPDENENSMEAMSGEWKLSWRRFGVRFDDKVGVILMGQFSKKDNMQGRKVPVAGMIRTNIQALLEAIDQSIWSEIASAPQDGTVVWLKGAEMAEPCLGSFRQCHVDGSLHWMSVNRSDDGSYLPSSSSSFQIKADQWRSGMEQVERAMPTCLDRTFMQLQIEASEEDERDFDMLVIE